MRLLATLLDPLAWRMSRRELHPLLARTSLPGIISATDEYMGRGHYRHISALHNRDETRRLLTPEQIEANKEGIRKVFSRFLAFGDGATDAPGRPRPARLRKERTSC